MIRILLSAALTSLAVSGRAQSQCTFSESSVLKRPVLAYRFALRTVADTTTLAVTLDFSSSPTGVDTLGVPTQSAGQRLHAMHSLRGLDAGVEIDTIPGRDARLVRHAPGARVRIAYELTNDWSGPFNHPYEFHPVIFADYLEVTGDNALAHPRFSDPYTPVTAFFDWTGLPESWALATSFGTAERATQRNTRCQTFAGPWRDVNQALYAAGDFRVRRFTIGRQPAVLAIRGAYPYSDSAAVVEIQRDVGLVRDFWHDDRFPYFLVTWAPFDRDHNSGDGTAFTNGLWMFVSRLDSLPQQTTQLTHEAFHAWDPRRMGRESNGEESRIGWFHEGFTMFYADAIAYRAGLISLSSVVRRVNRDLQSFMGSNDPYVRGDVIARWLDGAIRERSDGQRSLDDVMRDLVRENDRPLTLDRVLATANRYLAARDSTTLRDLATGAGAPPSTFFAGELAPCVRVTGDSLPGAGGTVPQLHIVDGYAPRPGTCGLSMR